MIDSVGIIVQSLQQDIQRMNVAASNASNALTNGFRREMLVPTHGFSRHLDAHAEPNRFTAMPMQMRVGTDMRPGALRQTGGGLDLAIAGDGFFEVLAEFGTAYTRQGSFRLDEQGRLVTSAGSPVLGDDGAEIRLRTSNPKVERDGRILEDGQEVARLKVVAFDRDVAVQNVGAGLLVPVDAARILQPLNRLVVQGHLEGSNVNAATEMIQVVETVRHFETGHRVLQAYDSISEMAHRSLGEF
jgi:flagellar basal-body rod protein FlgF